MSKVAIHETMTTFKINDFDDIQDLLSQIESSLNSFGFSKISICEIQTIASELGSNIVKYAKPGVIEYFITKELDRTGLNISAYDHGPGIIDTNAALKDYYTTSSNSLGIGLSSVRRLADDFFITSFVGIGTRVDVIKWNLA